MIELDDLKRKAERKQKVINNIENLRKTSDSELRLYLNNEGLHKELKRVYGRFYSSFNSKKASINMTILEFFEKKGNLLCKKVKKFVMNSPSISEGYRVLSSTSIPKRLMQRSMKEEEYIAYLNKEASFY